MEDTWKSLTEEQKENIRTNARKLTETEIGDRFVKRGEEVMFRILRKTDRTLAGRLDIDNRKPLSSTATDQNCHEAEDYEVSEIPLIPPESFDYEPEITDDDRDAEKAIDDSVSSLRGYYTQNEIPMGDAAILDPDINSLPSIVDHRPGQSPVKNQGKRGTCVAHASLALLEAYDHIPDDLSEQYAHYRFIELLGQSHVDTIGFRATEAAHLLSRDDGRVCEESDWPYISDQDTINQMVRLGSYAPPRICKDRSIYGYGANSHKIITDRGLTGESIKNPRYLESLLYKGYNIVIGAWVSWDDKDNDGVLDPVLDPKGNPIGFGGHAMLLVGYNRPSQYFIVKNSWGRGWGHDGYAYFHYNLACSCFKYGFVVDRVVPDAASGLSCKLSQAPYETNRISRQALEAAILLMETSQGRYAVCEAYSGDNLLLRNLCVYNPDGSLHLKRDSLIIRENYLFDIDSARETKLDADFCWNNGLVLRNSAMAYIAYDLAGLTSGKIRATTLNSNTIASNNLNYAVIIGRTSSGRYFKMLANIRPGNWLQLSYLEIFGYNGRRYRYSTNLYIRPSCTYSLDNMSPDSGKNADIFWCVSSNDAGYLESCPNASIELLWCL